MSVITNGPPPASDWSDHSTVSLVLTSRVRCQVGRSRCVCCVRLHSHCFSCVLSLECRSGAALSDHAVMSSGHIVSVCPALLFVTLTSRSRPAHSRRCASSDFNPAAVNPSSLHSDWSTGLADRSRGVYHSSTPGGSSESVNGEDAQGPGTVALTVLSQAAGQLPEEGFQLGL